MEIRRCLPTLSTESARLAGPAPTLAFIFGEAQRIDNFLWEHLLAAAREFLKRETITRSLTDENDRNDVLASLMDRSLAFLGWNVADQPRGGHSSTGITPGSRDWVVRDGSGELAIFEALNLASVDKSYIATHVKKAVYNYDAEFKQYCFVIVYYDGKNFAKFWEAYQTFVESLPPQDGAILIDQDDPLAGKQLGNISARVFRYEIDGIDKFVWHMEINLGPRNVPKSSS